MSNSYIEKNSLSDFIIDTLLKSTRDNTLGSVNIDDTNGDGNIVDDILSKDNAMAVGFSNLSKLNGVIISEILIKHFAEIL